MTVPAPTDVEALAAEQEAEYGTWVAVSPIFTEGNVRAFNIGHPVPKSHVDMYGYDKAGLVERADGSTPTLPPAATSPARGEDIVLKPSTIGKD